VIASTDDVRVVIVIRDVDGRTAGALWEDLEMGVEPLTTWKRIALVTAVEWMQHIAAMFGWMTPGQLERFPLTEREAALAWAAG